MTFLALITCVFLILVLAQGKSQFVIPLSVSVVFLIAAYVLQHQLNWWYYQKYPPRLPEPIHGLFSTVTEFYKSLTREQQQEFGRRVRLFVEAKEFFAKGMDDVPEDAKYIVGYYAVKSDWPDRDGMFEGYDRIVLYPHPFLTPKYSDEVHTVEVEHEDGTMIFSMEHLLASFFKPGKYYPIGHHAFAEALLHTSMEQPDAIPPDFWERVQETWHFSKQEILDFIGLQAIGEEAVLLTLYLHNPRKAAFSLGNGEAPAES